MSTIDLDHPIRSLRDLAGLTQSAAAERRGVAQPSQHQIEAQGSSVLLSTLVAAAERLGFTLELRAVEKRPRASKKSA